MRIFLTLAILMLASLLSSCGSALHHGNPNATLAFNPYANLPYWEVPGWQASLFRAVQSVVRAPAEMGHSIAAPIHGTVQFSIDNGAISIPKIVVSTGDPNWDKLLLQQVVTAKVPKPFGLHTEQPHEFELSVEMFKPYESFEYNVYAAINQKREYPRDALLRDKTGIATVAFDYLNGKAGNVTVVSTSGHNDLDQASLNTVSNTALPTPPMGYAGKTLQMRAIFCYDINFTKKCPTGANVIDVEGTRIKRTMTTVYP